MQLSAKKTQVLFITFFLGFITILALLLLKNLYSNKEGLKDKIFTDNPSQQVEIFIKDNFPGNLYFRDLKGIVYNILNKNILENFQFLKDDIGVVRIVTTDNRQRTIADSLKKIKDRTGNDTPVIFINIPDTQKHLKFKLMTLEGGETEILNDEVRKAGIEILDLNQMKIPLNDFWFQTDLHISTDAEILILNQIIKYLKQYHHNNFASLESFDLTHYESRSYPFIGNTSRNAGSFYTSIDKFLIYTPKSEMKFTFKNLDNGYFREGTFEQAVLNGMSEQELKNKYSYKVVDYGSFTSRLYQIQNLTSNNKIKVLVICDSIFMRGFSYLATLVSNVTIFDPRFNSDINFLGEYLDNNYVDVVLCLGISKSFFRSPF